MANSGLVNSQAWAKWAVENRAHANYTEGPERMSAIGVWPPKLPLNFDCSAFVTWILWVSGCLDPNGGTAYTIEKGQYVCHREGYTGTLLAHLPHVTDPQVGDLVVYGDGTGWHVALIVGVWGPDILTISHGEQGDPNYVWSHAPITQHQNGHAIDTRTPRTFLRPNYDIVGVEHLAPTAHVTIPPKPPVAPAPIQPASTPAPKPVQPNLAPAPAKPAGPFIPLGRPTIQKGSKGSSVSVLQKKLGLFPSGIFGNKTYVAVVLYQTRNHLTVDGVVGSETWRSLLGGTK